MFYSNLCIMIITCTFSIYILLDGKALALCLFTPFSYEKYRVRIFNALLPSWDANQTWLVFTMAALYGAFSAFFGQVLSHFYLCFIAMLLLLIVRGAAIEFSMKDRANRQLWYWMLSLSSMSILLLQSFIVVFLLLSQQQSAYNFHATAAQVIGFYTISIIALISFHIIRAMQYLNFKITILQASTWLPLFTLSTISSAIYLVLLTGHQHIQYMHIQLYTYVFLFITSIILTLFHPKGCIECYCSLVAIAVLASLFMYLYPFHSLTGSSSLLALSSGKTNAKIIAIASLVMLPILVISMYLLGRIFKASSETLSY